MDDTVDKVSINSATTINRLERLVQERCWELVLAHLQTIQGREDAMMRNSTSGKLLYHNPALYNHAPFDVIEALVKAYPKGIFEQHSGGNIIRDPIETVLFCTKEETRNMVFKL